MKKVYQLGVDSIIISEEINAFLRAKDYICIFDGISKWEKKYKLACDKIRKEFGFNYIININPAYNKRDRKDNIVVVKVFEVENDGGSYKTCYDINKDAYYIEVEDKE